MNTLPIPALDGGHVLFLCYEIITGKTARPFYGVCPDARIFLAAQFGAVC